MGDRPWQQPHEQASCSAHAEMIQASTAATSSIHGSIIKDPGGYEDLAELDQALFLYINSQDNQSVQEQPHFSSRVHVETLNIFPSRPMHVVAEPSPKAATSTSNIVAASSNLKPQRPPSKQSAMTAPGGKATVKREGSGSGGAGTPSTSEHEGPRTPDAKTLRRLAQNREAARKSRLRKKAYIQNLETSRVRLSQMEQEMQRCSAQGAILGGGAGIGGLGPEAAWFDGEYARWVDEHDRMMRHLRAAVDAEGVEHDAAVTDGEQLLRQLIDAAAAHHVVLAELKSAVARADVFHLVSGMWLPAAERCFIWIGGSRPSDLIKVMARHMEPLTEQQAAGMYDLQRWAQEREEALDRELQATYRSLSDTVSSDALISPYPDTAAYMAHMSLAISNLSSLEAFVRQADALRLQTLHRLPQVLTARQAARCFLAVADYSQRLRALSSLWLARPRQDQPAPPGAGGRLFHP
ncbi:hypothetical protein VPH35_104261 [Triticum aestivum]